MSDARLSEDVLRWPLLLLSPRRLLALLLVWSTEPRPMLVLPLAPPFCGCAAGPSGDEPSCCKVSRLRTAHLSCFLQVRARRVGMTVVCWESAWKSRARRRSSGPRARRRRDSGPGAMAARAHSALKALPEASRPRANTSARLEGRLLRTAVPLSVGW